MSAGAKAGDDRGPPPISTWQAPQRLERSAKARVATSSVGAASTCRAAAIIPARLDCGAGVSLFSTSAMRSCDARCAPGRSASTAATIPSAR